MPPGSVSKTKPEQTPEQRAMRLRGYELYLATDQDGRRRSLRAIAMTLGVTLGTVQYWRKKDKWDERLTAAMQAHTQAAGSSGRALAALLRTSLFEHIGTLNVMIRDVEEKPTTRLAAIRELADIALKLKVVDPADLLPESTKMTLGFKDDLHGTPPDDAQSHVQHHELQSGATETDDYDNGAVSGSSPSDGSPSEQGSVDGFPTPILSRSSGDGSGFDSRSGT